MKRLLLLLALLPSLAWAGDNDDWGTWLELSAEKALPYKIEMGLEADLRTKDHSSMMDRWNVGLNIGYKAHKYLKFSAGYSLLMDYNAENQGKKWLTPSHWQHRNRMFLDASSGYKFMKWLRVSARVRYQFSHRAAKHVDRYECEGTDGNTGEYVYDMDYPETKLFDCESRQVLRSRIKLEVDKKHLAWKPFVSAEFHNNLAIGAGMNFDKLRTGVGTSYKINRNNDVSISYVYTLNRMEHPYEHMHALSIGYSYDF